MDYKDHSDFHYVLSLLPPLSGDPQYAWLPELFSIIGVEKLILLCNYAGGETIKIPKLNELADAIEAVELYLDIHIKHTKSVRDIPPNLVPLVNRIAEVYKDA